MPNNPQTGLEKAIKARNAIRELIKIVHETIKEFSEKSVLKGIPNGELYSILMTLPFITFDVYTHLISEMKRAGLIKEWNNVLSWVKDLPEGF